MGQEAHWCPDLGAPEKGRRRGARGGSGLGGSSKEGALCFLGN